MTTFENIVVEDHDNGVVLIKINRPDKLNALSPEVFVDLKAATEQIAVRADLRAVIVTGEGRAFVAGADISAMADFTMDQAKAYGQSGHDVMDAISALPVPVIAALNGFTLGGGLELALACDLIYASDKAKIGLPEVGLAIIPGFGGTQRLGRLIGWQAAREMVFTGKTIDATEAKRLGLVLDVFTSDTLIGSVLEIANNIAARGPLAVKTAKEVMRQGSELPLKEANAVEVGGFAELWPSADRQEGMSAFVEKRAAVFTGK